MCNVCEPMRKVYLLFYHRHGLAGRAIQWFTRGRYSHVAFLFGDQILESTWRTGVWQRRVMDADGKADWFSVELSEQKYYRLLAWCQSHIGERYDWRAIVRFVTRQRCYRDAAWFCGEYCFGGLEFVGIPLLARTEPWEASPYLLVRSPLLTREGTT